MKNVVIQRVEERGWPNNYYAMHKLYEDRIVRQEVKKFPYLNYKDMNFVCRMFNLKRGSEMLQKQTLAPTTLELLKTLMDDAYLQEF